MAEYKSNYTGQEIDNAIKIAKTNLQDIFDINENGVVSIKIEYQNEGEKNYLLPEDLVIPDNVDNITVTALTDAMFKNNLHIISVKLPSTIQTIPQECFMGAINLVNVLGTENIENIEDKAFNTTKIEKISFENLTTMGEGVFQVCPYLESVNIGKVTNIPNYTFEHCQNLKEVIHENDINSVGVFSFHLTQSLKSIDFTSTLRNVGAGAFFQSAVNFDWSTLENCTFGDMATPLQYVQGLSLNPYKKNVKHYANNIPKPVAQGDIRWKNYPINENPNTNSAGVSVYALAKGCAFFSTMNAYCGLNNLEYNDARELIEMNKYIKPIVAPERIYKTYADLTANVTVSSDVYKNDYKVISDETHNEQTSYYTVESVDGTASNMKLEYAGSDNNAVFNKLLGSNGMDDFCEGLGFNSESTLIDLNAHDLNYYIDDIVSNIRGGAYCLLSTIGTNLTYNSDTQKVIFPGTHAILLYGVNEDNEIMYVNSSSKTDKFNNPTGIIASMPLQNIVTHLPGTYQLARYAILTPKISQVNNPIIDKKIDEKIYPASNTVSQSGTIIFDSQATDLVVTGLDFKPDTISIIASLPLSAELPDINVNVSAIVQENKNITSGKYGFVYYIDKTAHDYKSTGFSNSNPVTFSENGFTFHRTSSVFIPNVEYHWIASKTYKTLTGTIKTFEDTEAEIHLGNLNPNKITLIAESDVIPKDLNAFWLISLNLIKTANSNNFNLGVQASHITSGAIGIYTTYMKNYSWDIREENGEYILKLKNLFYNGTDYPIYFGKNTTYRWIASE